MGLFGRFGGERMRGPEKVRGAVIRYEDENFVASNHTLALDELRKRFPDYTPEKEQARGWLTTRGRIVNAEEAQGMEIEAKARTGEETDIMRDPESTLFREHNE